ncbi:THO complex subunit 5A-like [Chenopodium quinoa]|uniref:THO complex subunit 5A-like n=1 Tax=Chenopodium quinoa TaxID=63459 RepID=UPI000B78476B|nr:THO complex subunit 5A-like [Chenopodium quinoa]
MDVKMEDAAASTASTSEANVAPPTAVEKSPYDLLKKSKLSVEEIVAKMLSLKKDDKPKPELRELVTQMFLNFVSLRQANRKILIEEDRVKAETERAKAPVDSTSLQLHNLMYEKSHYLKAIKACKDFKSKYPDIQLVTEAEFFSQAPEEFKGTAVSNETAHNLMLKRLNYELFQRKELCKLRETLEQKKKSFLETIANRKKFLSSLPSHLKALKKASLPAQNQLGLLHTKKQKQLHAAELLPQPLYIIYSQFMAQKEAFGENIELEIIGSLKDAQAFVRRQTQKDTGISSMQESSRIDDDVVDEEDDGQRRRKRPKKMAGKENADAAGIYQAHPLRIILHVHENEVSDPKSARLVTLKFEYLFKLNVVCVGVEGSDQGPENNILCNLFPDDTGLELPHQSAKLLLGDGAEFDEKRTMRPYKWAQHLAGIDFLPELSPSSTSNEAAKFEAGKDSVISGLSLYRQQNRVQTVVQRVRLRKKAQLALAEQLDSLTKHTWPPLRCQSVPWAAHEHLCFLHRWSPQGSSLNQGIPLARVEVEQGHISLDTNMAGRAGSSKEEGIVTEDGELPSLVPAAVVTDEKSTANLNQGSVAKHSKRMTLISKNITVPVKTARNQSFGRNEDDIDLMMDSESEVDDTPQTDREDESIDEGNFWVNYAVKEFELILTRKRDVEEGDVDLEAKICISMEYPLRPPLFRLSLCAQSSDGNSSSFNHSIWYNELRAMEAEVNLHILKMLPPDQEEYILSHQVHCLAMLFDLYLNEASQPLEIDIGLCKPVSGDLKARSIRGRDRRKMISWKGMECTPGYPY